MYLSSINSPRDLPLAIAADMLWGIFVYNVIMVTCKYKAIHRSVHYLKSIVFYWSATIMTTTMSPSHWEGIQYITIVYVYSSYPVELRRQSRKLESEIDQKLVSFSKLSTSYGQRDTSQ